MKMKRVMSVCTIKTSVYSLTGFQSKALIMSSKRRQYYSSDDDSTSYSSSSSESDCHSKHRHSKKKKRSRHSKHKSKHKHRHKKHRKEKRSKHKKKSKSKSTSKYKHHDKDKDKHQKLRKRHKNDEDHDLEPISKKRKLNIAQDVENNDNNDPCASKKELIQNAKTVLKMICDNDDTKQYMINIFTKLDNKESISISDHIYYKRPLDMIFTFLLLNTTDNNTYNKTDDSLSLLSTFKKQLKLSKSTQPQFIGPAMPPSDYKRSSNSNSSKPSIETNTDNIPGIIGVTMPTNTDLMNNKYSSEDDDDMYGPASLNGENDKQRMAQMQHTKIIAEMNKKIKGDDVDAEIEKNDNKRPEWMTQMPASLMSDYDKGTKGRGFNQNEHKQDSSWTETPGDIEKQKKEAKRRRKIQEEYNEKLKELGLPTVQEQNKQALEDNVGDKDIEKRSDIQERAKSLFEIHQEKLRDDFKKELKEWKRKKKSGEKVGPKPVFKGVKLHDTNTNYAGSMDSYYNAQNPVFTRSKLNSFVSGGTIDKY